jgi:hypothetical protein
MQEAETEESHDKPYYLSADVCLLRNVWGSCAAALYQKTVPLGRHWCPGWEPNDVTNCPARPPLVSRLGTQRRNKRRCSRWRMLFFFKADSERRAAHCLFKFWIIHKTVFRLHSLWVYFAVSRLSHIPPIASGDSPLFERYPVGESRIVVTVFPTPCRRSLACTLN